MSDTDEPLDRLGQFDPGAPMPPLPPSEVRRRGDRRRRRTTTLVAVGAAAAVAAVAIPLAVLSSGDQQAIEPARPATVSADLDLLDASDIATRDGMEPWAVDTGGRADDTPVIACAPGPVDDLGARAMLTRDFVTEFTLPPGTTADPNAPDIPQGQAREAVLQFADADTAGAAYDEALGWITDCPGGDDGARPRGKHRDVMVEGGRSQYAAWSLTAVDYCPEGCDARRFADMGVSQVGDRLVLTSYQVITGSFPPEDFDASMTPFVSNATVKAGPDVDRLASDEAGPEAPTEPTTAAPSVGTGAEIADDFPLSTGSFAAGESDVDVIGPSPSAPGVTLPADFCGADLWPSSAAVDRLGFGESGPEYGLSRELAVFDTAKDAVRILDNLRDALVECPTAATEGDPTLPGSQTLYFDEVEASTGYDDVAFTRAAGAGLSGDAVLYVRVGRAIYASSTSGEYSRDSVNLAVGELVTNGAAVVAAMCPFTEAGC